MRYEFTSGGPLWPLFSILGMGRRHSWIELEDGHLGVRMGWGFRMKAPTSAIASAEQVPEPISLLLGIGVHGWSRQWAVNTARRPHVAIRFAAPQRGRTAGFPVRVEVLHLSPADPAALLRALRG